MVALDDSGIGFEMGLGSMVELRDSASSIKDWIEQLLVREVGF